MATSRTHEAAVERFADRVAGADVPGVKRLILFGSVARDTHDEDSDIDVLAIVGDDADTFATEEHLRDIAYDIMLEHGAPFSIHGVAESTLERRADHPFFRRAVREGRTIHG